MTSAGAGREVLALATTGRQVVGFEPNESLVRFGNELLAADGVEARIRPCDRDMWPAEAGQADGLVIGWSGYMCIPDRARRVAFLRAAVRVLPTGAPVLLSFFAIGQPDVRLRTAASIAAPLRRLRGRSPVSVGDALMPMLVHVFTRPELEQELADGGIDLIEYCTTDYGWAVGRVRPQPGGDNR